MKSMSLSITILIQLILITSMVTTVDFPVVDTGQTVCYNATTEITCPSDGDAFYGQDAHYQGPSMSYTTSQDGLTVRDNTTGLIWMKTPDTDGDLDVDSNDKLTWNETQGFVDTLNAQSYGGYNSWQVPTIKELYSLMDFRGIDPSGFSGSTENLVPFIDTDYFDFAFGDESAGERIIDAQYWSSTQYVGTVMGGQIAHFGVNVADGRIKGYPRDMGPGGSMSQFLRCVCGNESFGQNAFADNGDGTITDTATGLMWQQADSGTGMIWEDSLAYAESLSLAGHDDWRLPTAKELQSLVDYTRAPSVTDSPAIDPIFLSTPITDEGGGVNYASYWTGTTHSNWSTNPGRNAAYVCFGEALGFMEQPPGSGNYTLMDVHGAGAQRSDPKTGNPDDYPYGHGPQGDVIRIFNFVRCVRDTESTTQPSVTLEMPGTYFEPGDTCYLKAVLTNPGDNLADAPLVVLLGVAGEYFFWPSWEQSLDYGSINVPTGATEEMIIPTFTWPQLDTDPVTGLVFWGAMLSSDLTTILGGASGLGYWEFGFGAPGV